MESLSVLKLSLACSRKLVVHNSVSGICSYIISNPLGLVYNELTIIEDSGINKTEKFENQTYLRLYEDQDEISTVIDCFNENCPCSIYFTSKNDLVSIYIEITYKTFSKNNASGILDFFKRLFEWLPESNVGYSSTLESIEFYADLQSKLGFIYPHRSFNPCLCWFNFMAKEEYEPFYTKKTLLEAPAFIVEEWGNESIFFQAYESPDDFEKEEDRLIAISEYLAENENEIEQL